jgi:hypothetical protein
MKPRRSWESAVLLATALVAAAMVVSCAQQNQAPLVGPVQLTANPHAGFEPAEVVPGSGRRAVVLEVLTAGEYNYLSVDEGGTQYWVAELATMVKKGDVVEFIATVPVVNYASKRLGRSFASLYFVQGLRNDATQ